MNATLHSLAAIGIQSHQEFDNLVLRQILTMKILEVSIYSTISSL